MNAGTYSTHPAEATAVKPSSIGFWFLVGLSMLGFVPCVLMPVWEDYVGIVQIERQEQAVNDSLRGEISQLDRRRVAIQTDPTVTLRAARRELGYRRAGDVVVHVGTAAGPIAMINTPPLSEQGASVEPPAFMRGLLGHLPDLDYRAVFVEEPTRTFVLSISAAAMLAAFVLYLRWPARQLAPASIESFPGSTHP